MNNNEKIIDENTHVYDNGFKPKEVKLKSNYVFFRHDILFRIRHFITIYSTVIVQFFVKRIFFGFKVKGRKNLRGYKKGNIILMNHIHPNDVFMMGTNIMPRKIYITMLQSNLGFPIVSQIFRGCGAVPIPETKDEIKRFKKEMLESISRGGNVIFMPEAALIPYCDYIRPFKKGAFRYAVEANAPIIPTVFTYRYPRGIYKLYKKKPCFTLNILEPYIIKSAATKAETIDIVTQDLYNIMSKFFNDNSEITALNHKKKK